MFSGLTSQVSNWMGKKNEDNIPSEVQNEDKNASSSATGGGAGNEGEFDGEKKDSSPTKGSSKLEMLAGVKSQMSGWLSGGIPRLGKATGGGGQDEADVQPPPPHGAESQTSRESVQGSASEHAKDDDKSEASSATGGVDSGPASLDGTPTEDKDGQQAFGAVSTKALAGAKSLGGFLYSAVNKAGKSVVEASAKIKKTVEENSLLGEFNKEQDAFIASKQGEKGGEAVAPWIGAPNEDALREECLALSTDRRNFVRAPPPGVEFVWDFEAAQPVAQATLALDPNLETMRFELVPKIISEENFWRNYFYRVSLLRQSHELNAMASQTNAESNQNLISSSGSIDRTQDNMEGKKKSNEESRIENTESGHRTSSQSSASGGGQQRMSGTDDSQLHHHHHTNNEFVSDTVRASDTDIEEVREGMKKLGMQLPPKEEEWERELEAELKDFEVVTTGHNKLSTTIISGNTTSSSLNNDGTTTTTILKEDWEEQIDELLGEEDDLK